MGCAAKFSGALPGCVADTVSSIVPNRATRDNRIRSCVNAPLKKRIYPFRFLQDAQKLIICAVIDVLQLIEDGNSDVKLARLVLCVGRAANVAAAPLKLGAQLLLRQAVSTAQSAQILSDVAVAPQFLFHHISPDPVAFDQYWLQLNRVYAKL